MNSILRAACVLAAAGVLSCLSGLLAACEVAYDDDTPVPPPTTAPAPGAVERSETNATDLEGAAGSAIDAAEERSGSYLGQARDAATRTIGAVEERSRAIGGDSP